MGDPECQVIMPRLKTELVEIIDGAIKNKLNKIKIKWNKKKSMTIVLCTKGYPNKYKKNLPILNLEKIKQDKDSIIYHAGTKILNKKIFSDGGRVLSVTCLGQNYFSIRKKIIKMLKKINWKHGFFRKDIGWRVI